MLTTMNAYPMLYKFLLEKGFQALVSYDIAVQQDANLPSDIDRVLDNGRRSAVQHNNIQSDLNKIVPYHFHIIERLYDKSCNCWELEVEDLTETAWCTRFMSDDLVCSIVKIASCPTAEQEAIAQQLYDHITKAHATALVNYEETVSCHNYIENIVSKLRADAHSQGLWLAVYNAMISDISRAASDRMRSKWNGVKELWSKKNSFAGVFE